MKRKLYTILTVLMIVMLTTSPALARGAIKLSSSDFALGSLIATGVATGLSNIDWRFEVNANGHASVICTNYGSNDVPGQSSPHVDGKGTQDVPHEDITKNGKSSFTVIAKPEEEINTTIPWDAGGCPNPNWSARIDFVYWDSATVNVIDPATPDVIAATFKFSCVTTRIPQNDGYTFDDGTVSCTRVN